MVAKILGRQFS